jgi:hypothetical protein
VHHSVVWPAVLAVAVVSAPPARADTLRYVYGPSSGAGSGLEGPVAAQRTPLGHPAVLGYFRFVPRRDSFRLTVNELTALRGQTVPVAVTGYRLGADGTYTRNGWTYRCLPVRTPVTFQLARGSSLVTVWVLSDLDVIGDLSCSGHAVSGTAQVDR